MTLDRRTIRRHFSQAAQQYDQHAGLQREVCQRLVERLDGLRFEPTQVLDLGCGTGFGQHLLGQRFPAARLLGVDLALPMLERARARAGWWQRLRGQRPRLACGDAYALPVASGSTDLVFSSLMLQWCDEPERVLTELRRVLKPGGLLLLSTFGLDTLKELRQAWGQVDGHDHVSRFTEVQALGSAITRSGFMEPVLDTDWLTTHYDKPLELLQELKGIGASNASQQRNPALTAPRRLKAMLSHYEAFRLPDGRYPATWEVLYASAWAPEHGQALRLEGREEASIPIDQIKVRQR